MSEMGGKYIEVDSGVELFVQDVGKGDPILLIPGWTFTSEVFEKQIEYFQRTNRVIAIDPRSHGKSTMTLHGNNYETHGLDLKKVIDALELRNVSLVGWSFGCLTIWEYIRQFGLENINSLVLIDLSPKPLSVNADDWVEGPLDEIGAVYNTYLKTPAKQREFVTSYVQYVMIQREVEPAELSWLVNQSLSTPYYIAANLFASGMFSDYREEAKRASEQVPTLTVIAEHWAETATAFTNKVSPDTTIEVLGGHLMFWEHADKFNRILEEFLNSAT